MLSRKAPGEDPQADWLQEETGEQEGEIKWLNPKPKTRIQAALDSAKALSERVYCAFRYVASATTYLPHQLKGGATSAYEKAQELYSTLKPVSRLLMPHDKIHSCYDNLSTLQKTTHTHTHTHRSKFLLIYQPML